VLLNQNALQIAVLGSNLFIVCVYVYIGFGIHPHNYVQIVAMGAHSAIISPIVFLANLDLH